MKVHQIMSAPARCVSPDNMLVEAAGLMRQLDVGALPVCDDETVTGMITDRDIVIRATADGRDPNRTPVGEVMTSGIVAVFADQEVEEAARAMQRHEIRRLPVLDRGRHLVGTLSLGDLAMSSNPAFSGLTLREVSQPKVGDARDRKREALGRSATGLAVVATTELRLAGRDGSGTPTAAKARGRKRSQAGVRGGTSGRKSRGRKSPSRAGRSSSPRAARAGKGGAGAKRGGPR